MCRCEKLDQTRFLLFRQLVEDKKEVNVSCTGKEKLTETPLYLLCKNNKSDGLFDCVEFLLQQRPNIQINQTTEDGFNALLWLCHWSESAKILEVIQLLIAKGIDINQTNRLYGKNALMFMCERPERSGQIVEVTQLLIENKIDINQMDEWGRNALILMCKSASDKICEVSQLLIAKGIDINQTDKHGRNALMSLCEQSKREEIVEVTQLLIENKVDINQTDEHGMNALMLLCNWSKSGKILEVAQLLISNGIDINQTSKNGMNALMKLCLNPESEKLVEVAQLLIANGIDINHKNVRGFTVADFLKRDDSISESDKEEIIALLLQQHHEV